MTLPTYKGLTMSGLFGYFSTEPKDVFTSIYFGIYALQHRGQQSSGIATVHDGEVDLCVGPGLIKRSFARGKNDKFALFALTRQPVGAVIRLFRKRPSISPCQLKKLVNPLIRVARPAIAR